MGPIPMSQFRPPLPYTSPNIRKDNAVEKGKRAVPKRFRPSTTPKSTTACLPIPEAPPKPKTDVAETRPPPSVPVCESTPWPGTGKASGNLFEDGNWLLPPNYLDNENKNDNEHKNATSVNSPRPTIKEEEKPKEGEQSAEKCRWGPDCPFCKNQEKKEEENKTQQQQKPKVQKPQARRPKTLNLTDKYPSQSKIKQQWETEMERLNSKYNLNCFSDSELDLESDEGEQHCYEHGYETLI